jgi:ABC-type uncharacterized transport system permease subunit
MEDEKRLRTGIVVSGFIFLAVAIVSAKLVGDSYLISVGAIVGWFVFLAYLLKLRSLGKRGRSRSRGE